MMDAVPDQEICYNRVMGASDDRCLWQTDRVACLMISCCAGAELQVRRLDGEQEIVLRELYPTKSDLYERARMLEVEYRSRGA